jgi:hypothetical protein
MESVDKADKANTTAAFHIFHVSDDLENDYIEPWDI